MTNEIKNVEIFHEGLHNGDQYTAQDLDDMVNAFHALDYRPALKVGHTRDTPGAPAYGWVQNLKRVGNKLVADFTDMHESVMQAIRDRRYGRVSSEIYFNLKRGGKEFRRALKAVALLGAEVPAVANLTPLHKMEFAQYDFEKVAVAMEQPFTPTAGEQLDELIREHMDLTGMESYAEAMTAVLAENEDLRRDYAMSDDLLPAQQDQQRWQNAMGGPDLREERQNAGMQIQRLVLAEIARNPTLTQMSAMKIVLQKNPALAEAYRAGHGWIGTSFDAIMGA